MSPSNLPPRPSEAAPNTPDQIAQEIDVQTALALSRAATQALRAMGPLSRHAIEDAVEAEIALQDLREGVVPSIVTAMLRAEIAEAA